MSESENYFNYLKKRSAVGDAYRRFWLYPYLSRQLKGKALDLGCGIGDFLSYRPNTVGVDINENTVGWCKKLGHVVDLMEINVLPYTDNSFDSIIMDNVLEHIADPIPILDEVYRVLNHNGLLVVGVPGKKGYARDADHKIFYSKEKLAEVVSSAGFELRSLKAMPINLNLLDKVLSQYCIYGVFEKIG